MFIFFISGFLLYFKKETTRKIGDGRTVQLEIEKGESLFDISKKLEEKKLVKSKTVFYLYDRIKNKKVVAGRYVIPNNLSVAEISDILDKGERQVRRITIPEGWRVEQVATFLEINTGILATDFLALAKDSEGKLFPDTYDLMDRPTAEEVIKKMSDNFSNKTLGLNLDYNDIILASIIEREAANDSEREAIAGVFANRLKIGMRLEADPTVQYQKDNNNYPRIGLVSYNFWQKLEVGDLRGVQGNFNTYLNQNLPPSPICNPGIKSLQAAKNPAKHDFYFFLHGSDGKIYFSKNVTEHNQKKSLYL